MTEQWTQGERGAAEEASGSPATPAETGEGRSAASDDSGDVRARGYAEEATDSPQTE